LGQSDRSVRPGQNSRLYSRSFIEYIPLINALAEQGQIQQALDVTNQAIKLSDTVTLAACSLWQNLITENKDITAGEVSSALGEKTCSR